MSDKAAVLSLPVDLPVCRQINCGHRYTLLQIQKVFSVHPNKYLYGFGYELSVFRCLQTSVHNMGKFSLFLLCESTWGGERQE